MKAKFYDVHVFFNRKNGYSIPVKIETEQSELSDDDVIQYCVNNDLFSENGDELYVDYVTEIDENEYRHMNGDE